jgi:hypothetical protein
MEKPQQLTRSEFYKLSHQCLDYARRLATHDQDEVNRELCREYNQFLDHVRSYDLLRQPLARLRPARGITRWMVLSAVLLVWLLLSVVGSQFFGQLSLMLLLGISTMLIFMVYLVPPAAYGTPVEQIEGGVLAVVTELQKILSSEQLNLSEAAYFVVRDVLQEASDELRQQVYLSRAELR